LAVLGCASWSPGETERRLCAASYGSETGQENWPPEFFSEPLQRGNSPGTSLTNDFPLYLRRVSEMTSDRHWRTWRNTSSFARTRRCGATGWTDGIVPIQSLKHQTPGVRTSQRDVVAFHWRQTRPTDPHAAGAGPFDPACDIAFRLWPMNWFIEARSVSWRPVDGVFARISGLRTRRSLPDLTPEAQAPQDP
jgi:hypothetical protein